jgi:arylsulfatase A-like enzyme
VLLLFADQHKASVLGSEGHPDAITPNLDRLASEGVRFSRAYCQDGISVPSRCSMMSGLYPRTLGCLTNGDRTIVMREVVPLQKSLQANGYLTAAFGKRHLVLACDDGWDVAASGAGVCSIRLAGFAAIGMAGGNIVESGTRALCSHYCERFDEALAIIG